MDQTRLVVVQRTAKFAGIIAATAPAFTLDPFLVCGVICQESAGDPFALRVERGFWARYMKGIIANIQATPSKNDDRWLPYPDLVSASYGLMQVMYEVAIEKGFADKLPYPTSMCDPTLGIEIGCTVLKSCFDRLVKRTVVPFNETPADKVVLALLAYNGGAAPGYPGGVLLWKADCQASGLFPPWK